MKSREALAVGYCIVLPAGVAQYQIAGCKVAMPRCFDARHNATNGGVIQAWVCDITYIRSRSGWLYLAAVLDLHSRKITGWAMAPEMPATLVCAALQMAIAQRNPAQGLLVHSERGTQYASGVDQALLTKHGLVGSMEPQRQLRG